MAGKKKRRADKKPADIPRSKGPRREEKMIVNPKTGKKEKAIIMYD